MGHIPIMLRSMACHLHGMTPAELVKKGEHEQEWGGYFIVGGHERLIRMLQTTRRNYPVAMCRGSWKNRGKIFCDKVILRRGEQSEAKVDSPPPVLSIHEARQWLKAQNLEGKL